MKNSQLVWQSFLHALGVVIYVLLVAWIMSNGQRWFGQANNLLGASAILLLLVFSATVVGLLVLGRPAFWYFAGQKTEALKFLLVILGWLSVFIVLAFIILALRH